MRRLLFAAVLAAGCSSSPQEAPARAPEFEVRSLDGAAVGGASLRPALLVFMTSW
jgi:hypothetical protein